MRSSGSNRSSADSVQVEAPFDRALGLLRSFLDEEQLQDLERLKGFRYRKGDRLYWIPLSGPRKCAFLSLGQIFRYCIHTTDTEIPAPDQALTFLTWITSAPDQFHAWANVIQTRPIVHCESESELLELLIFERTVGTGESPYTIYRGPPPPSESDRKLAKAKTKELSFQLRKDLIKDRLALVDIGSDRALDQLAKEWPFR